MQWKKDDHRYAYSGSKNNPETKAAAEAASNKDIKSLIADLGVGSFAKREAATKELVKRGQEAVPALRDALGSPDSEVKRRAAAILKEIQRNEE